MHNIILFDGSSWDTMQPLTSLRPVAMCQVGALTICQKWQQSLGVSCSLLTKEHLQELFPLKWERVNILIDGSVLPTDEIIEAIKQLKPGQTICHNGHHLAFCFKGERFGAAQIPSVADGYSNIEIEVERIIYPEDILNHSETQLRKDVKLLLSVNQFITPDKSVRIRGDEVYVEEGAKVYDCILNSQEGPIYISTGAEIMENAVIRGPAFIGPNCTVHVGAKVYGNTCLGTYSKVGGEIKRTTIFGYSNKAHDGYLGDSVIGMWCNLGADTNNSNMKNTYGKVSLWNMSSGDFRVTDRQFLGLIMGDHSMAAINTSFMTGSVVGTFSNVHGISTPRFHPPFSWGQDGIYDINKAILVAHRAMERRGLHVKPAYENALRFIYQER